MVSKKAPSKLDKESRPRAARWQDCTISLDYYDYNYKSQARRDCYA